MTTLQSFWQHWRNFFFAPTNPLPIVVFRIILALVVLQTAVVQLWPDFLLYYGKNAAISVDPVIVNYWQNDPQFDLLLLFPGSDEFKYQLLALLIVAAFTLLIGFCSRASAMVMFLIILSIHRHSPISQNSGDAMVRIACLFLSLSAPGAALSVDSLLKNFKRDWRKEGFGPLPASPWAQRMLQLQTSAAYLVTILGPGGKLAGEQWIKGTAVYFVIREKEFWTGLPVPGILENPLVDRLLTWFTLLVEFSLAILVWFSEIRYFILFSGLIMHIGFGWMLNVGMFEETFVALLILFVKPEDLQFVLDKMQRFFVDRLKPTTKSLHFDGNCPTCLGWTGTFLRLDYFKRLIAFDDSDVTKLTVEEGAKQCTGVAALRSICCSSPFMWPFLLLLCLPGADLVANKISHHTHTCLPQVPTVQ